MPLFKRIMWILLSSVAFVIVAIAIALLIKLNQIEGSLPSVSSLQAPNLGAPLKIYSFDGKLIGEFGVERRTPLSYGQFPDQLIKAFLASEDDQYFQHGGVDYLGLVRATLKLAATGEKRQGGSTITMQLARNVFLTPERSYERKIKEILLARKMERELTKEQILEIYLNRIFLGTRSYGVAAAAYVYYGKTVDELTLREAAIIAGLPKAPSRDNPIASPERAASRSDYVLRRMRELEFITESAYQAALSEPVYAREHLPKTELEAEYVAEMVRAHMLETYGEAAYTDGYRVTTTITEPRQRAANEAVFNAVVAYEERHGYDGAEARAEGELLRAITEGVSPDTEAIDQLLKARPSLAKMPAALVMKVLGDGFSIFSRERGQELLPKSALAWAGARGKVQVGDVIRIRVDKDSLRLSQLPKVQGAFVALNAEDGAVQALVGGFDFALGRYNRVIQAQRQPGSGFKPFLYAAALAKGYTPASVFLDAPLVFYEPGMPEAWSPSNYDRTFKGPMRLREALVQSRNLVSVRVMQAVGMTYALNYFENFGFAKGRIPRNLSVSLGSASLTPMEVARANAVIANGGFLIDPYFISKIEDARGELVTQAKPVRSCPECDPEITAGDKDSQIAPRTVDPKTVYMLRSMMHDVATRGTAAATNVLERKDLAGKTGTSNDETDAWFNGFNSAVVATAWMGYDQPKPLGKGEVGGKASLPMWIDFMRVALKDVPESLIVKPDGMVDVAINRYNGKRAYEGSGGVIYETLPAARVPPMDVGRSAVDDGESEAGEAAQDLY